jgi:DNA polymerase IIIc chi subunit
MTVNNKKLIVYISFENLLYKNICTLLEKSYQTGDRTLVVAESEEQQEEINKILWTYSQQKFIPHGSSNDPLPEEQPIYITTKLDNKNNSKILMLLKCDQDILNQIDKDNFSKVLIFIKDEQINDLISLDCTFYRQNSKGSWSQ